jgi:tRNA modification GTPase
VLPQGRHSFTWTPKSHRVYYGSIVDPGTGATIDEVILLTMLCPRSYTMEDVVEVQCHGGGVSARRVLGAAIGAGARPARAGEFTLRAFLNGRLDLSQVRCRGHQGTPAGVGLAASVMHNAAGASPAAQHGCRSEW